MQGLMMRAGEKTMPRLFGSISKRNALGNVAYINTIYQKELSEHFSKRQVSVLTDRQVPVSCRI